MESRKINETSNKKLISGTLARRMMACIEEYERIKRKESKTFRLVKDFCAFHGFSHQNFMKVYHRYLKNPVAESLVPQKRGPRFRTRRTDLTLEARVVEIRRQGLNRYEIHDILKRDGITLAPSTIYVICRRYGLNRLKAPEKAEKRRIIKERLGEMYHIDCHDLSRGITLDGKTKLRLLGVIDDFSRAAWVEVLPDKKAITVMFATLRAFNRLKVQYGIEAESAMTDNGAEFGSGKAARNKDTHPFERLLQEMAIKHLYTKPYSPQTNGKIERFWKTLNEDLLEDATYNDREDPRRTNSSPISEHRPHSALNGKTPITLTKRCN